MKGAGEHWGLPQGVIFSGSHVSLACDRLIIFNIRTDVPCRMETASLLIMDSDVTVFAVRGSICQNPRLGLWSTATSALILSLAPDLPHGTRITLGLCLGPPCVVEDSWLPRD